MKKKTSKKTAKKLPLPFNAKATKGKVRVHMLIAVDRRGFVTTLCPPASYTMKRAVECLACAEDGPDSIEIHHLSAVVSVPKPAKPVKPKTAKAKVAKVKRESAAPASRPADIAKKKRMARKKEPAREEPVALTAAKAQFDEQSVRSNGVSAGSFLPD